VSARDLGDRIATVTQLGDVVSALRTLASARVRQAEERFGGLERYAAATRRALEEALALLESEPVAPAAARGGGRRVIALFTEHGFVGGLNERVLEAATACAAGEAEIVAVGARGRRLCAERNVRVVSGGAMPTTADGAQGTAQRLVEAIFADLAAGRVAVVHVVFAEHGSNARTSPRTLRLVPHEVTAAERRAIAPLHTLEASALVARAIEEYVYAQLTWAVGAAFASEYAARLAAMETSRRHIDDKLDELRRLERATRQEAITSELLEIASGAEMLSREGP
jgi:F-type H+-transporting ATPase subunit gamma